MKTLNKFLLVLNIFFLQSYLIRFQIGNYPSNLQEILIAAQIFTFIYTTPIKQIFRALSKRWIILTFILLTGLSAMIVPIDNRLDFVRHFKFLFFAIILSFIFLETFLTDNERKAGLHIMGLGALTFGIFSVIYNTLGYNQAYDLRVQGPLDAAVYLAFYLTPFFIFFAIQFFQNTKKKINLLYAILLGLLVLSTRSMGAIGGSFLILILYFFKRSNLKFLKSKLSKIILSLLAIIVAGTIFYTKILPTLKTDYSSLDERGEIWQTSAHLLKKPENLIFGVGFGQFQEKYFDNVQNTLDGRIPLDFYVLQPHNIFLLFIFHYGILGLIFIVYCIYKTTHKILKAKKFQFQIFASFILLYFFIHGLIDTPFFKNDILILFILFLELSLTKLTSNQPQDSAMPHKDPELLPLRKPTKRRTRPKTKRSLRPRRS